MKKFHFKYATNTFMVYHFFYTGHHNRFEWTPASLQFGGIGVCPYPSLKHINLRYLIEEWEVDQGLRPQRFFLRMFSMQRKKGTLGLKLVQSGLLQHEAYKIEELLRPEGYNNSYDRRIWNTKKGGKP